MQLHDLKKIYIKRGWHQSGIKDESQVAVYQAGEDRRANTEEKAEYRDLHPDTHQVAQRAPWARGHWGSLLHYGVQTHSERSVSSGPES